jgi:hypothetical protein
VKSGGGLEEKEINYEGDQNTTIFMNHHLFPDYLYTGLFNKIETKFGNTKFQSHPTF